MTQFTSRIRSHQAVYRAFFAVARDDALAYPVSFFIQQLSGLTLVIPFFFISQFLAAGDNYFEFVVVALMINHLLNAGLVDMGEIVQTLISRGTFEFALTQPIRWLHAPFALVLWPLLVRLGLACALIVMALVLGANLYPTDLHLLVPILVMSMTAVLGIGLLGLAARIQTKRSDPATMAYMFGLWIFSGVYFPVTSLPGLLQPISWLFPHAFAIDAIRSLTVESATPALHPPSTSLLILSVYSAVLLPISLFALHRSFEVGRRTGGLTAY